MARGSDPGRGRGIFSSPELSTSCGSHPASHSLGTGTFFVGVKRPWREVATHLHLVPLFRMTGAMPVPFLHPRVETYQLIPYYHQ